MSRHPFLESFDGTLESRLRETQEEALEALKSAAYEQGYASGWDDAIASDKTSRLKLEAEFERNIQGLAFTFSDAVTHVREELRELVEALMHQLLPGIAPDLLREHIRSELLKYGDELTDLPVELVASPDCNPTVAQMLKSDFSMDIRIIEDASLAEGQVYLRLGRRELEIDLAPLLRAITLQLQAIDAGSEEEGDTDV